MYNILFFSRKVISPVELQYTMEMQNAEAEEQRCDSVEERMRKLVNVKERLFISAAENTRAQKCYIKDFIKTWSNGIMIELSTNMHRI